MIITIDGLEKIDARLRALIGELNGAGRIELNRAMGAEVQFTTVAHLRTLATSRHDTAQRLGATPSNHLAQAADKVESPAALAADGQGATLTINHVGMIRAFRDVTITPRQRESLALPVHAQAYNRRAEEIFDALDCFIANGKIMMRGGGEADPITLYVLVKSVRQKQDRSLLPSTERWENAAAFGALERIRMVSGGAEA